MKWIRGIQKTIDRWWDQNSVWFSRCGVEIVERIGWNASLLDEVSHFGDADGGDADVVAFRDRVIDEGGRSLS